MASRIPPAENRRRALELSLSGANVATIAKELGVTERSVARYLAAAHDQLVAETQQSAATLRARQAATLGELQRSLWGQRTEPQAAAVILRVQERAAKLWGLDAPSQVQHLLEPGQVQTVLGFALSGALRLLGEIRDAIAETVTDEAARQVLVELVDNGQGVYVAEFEQRARTELQAPSEAA